MLSNTRVQHQQSSSWYKQKWVKSKALTLPIEIKKYHLPCLHNDTYYNKTASIFSFH